MLLASSEPAPDGRVPSLDPTEIVAGLTSWRLTDGVAYRGTDGQLPSPRQPTVGYLPPRLSEPQRLRPRLE